MKLCDVYEETDSEIEVVTAECSGGYSLDVQVSGYEMATSAENGIVIVENRGGIPYLVVWADITQEDPTHVISLENAKACLRPEDEFEKEPEPVAAEPKLRGGQLPKEDE